MGPLLETLAVLLPEGTPGLLLPAGEDSVLHMGLWGVRKRV